MRLSKNIGTTSPARDPVSSDDSLHVVHTLTPSRALEHSGHRFSLASFRSSHVIFDVDVSGTLVHVLCRAGHFFARTATSAVQWQYTATFSPLVPENQDGEVHVLPSSLVTLSSRLPCSI